MKVPVIMQMHSGENGAAALGMILAYYRKYLPMETIRKKCVSSRNGSTMEQLCNAAVSFGMDAVVEKLSFEELKQQSTPLIVGWKQRYYVVIRECKHGNVLLNDPSRGVYSVTEEKFKSVYSGKALIAKPGEAFQMEGKPVSTVRLLAGRIQAASRAPLWIAIFQGIVLAADLLIIVLSQHMLDDVVGDGKVNWYQPILLLLVVSLLLKVIFSCGQVFYSYKTSHRMAAVSGARLFQKLVSLPMKFYDQHYTGDVMERAEINTSLDLSLFQTIFPKITDAVMTFFYASLMFTYHPVIATVSYLFEMLYLMASLLIQKRISVLSHSINYSSGAMNASLINGLNTMETVKSAGAERRFFSAWRRQQEEFQKNKRKLANINILYLFFWGAHAVFTNAVIIFLGALFFMYGSFTLGMLASFQAVLMQLRESMNKSLLTINELSSMRSNIERIEDILTREPVQEHPLKESETPAKLAGFIDMDHVTFQYNEGDHPVVQDVTLHVKPGERVALVGATGCGKSTMMKLIADFYQPVSGTIRYDGKCREEIADVVFRSSIAVVDQEILLFEDNIENNLRLWDEMISQEDLVKGAKDAQIHERIMETDTGYATYVLENGVNYSAGEQQRMELARALSRKPSILLLDEFTSAMDALTEEKVFRALKERAVTCVIAAHRLSTIVDCDQIVVIERGKIVEHGTHEELYHANGPYRKLMDKQ